MFHSPRFSYPVSKEIPLPRVAHVRQIFEDHHLCSIEKHVREQLEKPEITGTIREGARIAVGVGSRGIANIADIVRELVAVLKEKGAHPFVFPAMGSHGGATPEGQKAILSSYGVTSAYIGAPVHATMEVVSPTELADGTSLYVDRMAFEADGIILVNRIKPHTNFRGEIESGIVKMMVIGMGKIEGANVLHSDQGMDHFGEVLPRAAKQLLPHIPFLFGVAILEDGYEHTAHIEAIPRAVLLQREMELLVQAKGWMPRLYFDTIDVLVIERIGKEISGSGFDPNIVGRNCRGVEGFNRPVVNKLVLCELSDQTHGNATGVGLADVITRSLFERIDFASTYTNVITSTYLDSASIPIVMDTAAEAVRLAIRAVPRVKPRAVRLVRIQDTLHLEHIRVSEPLLEWVRQHPKMEIISELQPLF